MHVLIDLFLTKIQIFASQDINWCKCTSKLVCVDCLWCFLRCLDSDGTHSLQRIHWWANENANFFKLFWLRNTCIYILNGLRDNLQKIFVWTVALNNSKIPKATTMWHTVTVNVIFRVCIKSDTGWNRPGTKQQHQFSIGSRSLWLWGVRLFSARLSSWIGACNETHCASSCPGLVWKFSN